MKTSIVIPVCGLFIAAASALTSYWQYEVAEMQRKIAYAVLMPQIEISIFSDNDKNSNVWIEIVSEGGPIYNFEVSNVSWIEVDGKDGVVYQKALSDLYPITKNHGKNKGKLATLYGSGNMADISKLLVVLQSRLNRGVSLNTIIKVKYVDALGASKVKYVVLRGFFSTHIEDDAGAALWRNVSSKKERYPLSVYGIHDNSELLSEMLLIK